MSFWEGENQIGLAWVTTWALPAGGSELLHNRVEMGQSLLNPERMDLAAGLDSFFQGLLEVVSGDLHRQGIAKLLASALLVLRPRGMWERDPNRLAVYQKFDIHGIGMPGGDGYDQRLIDAMDLFPRPALGGVEVIVHGVR